MKRKSTTEEWPPKELQLPNTIKGIEAGRPAAQPRDNSRAAVLARLGRLGRLTGDGVGGG
ncbi:MAG: hypothetical protein JW959_07040 [Pirellulales bacterium]|nr:hypothetical protein [Pirellulales bacterium]